MASKKDFGNIPTGRASSVLRTMEQATGQTGQQAAVGEAEALERMEGLRTQGRKGCKAVRINLAFSPTNHQYVRVMSRATGLTMTEFINKIIDQYRENNSEQYKIAKTLIDGLRGQTD